MRRLIAFCLFLICERCAIAGGEPLLLQKPFSKSGNIYYSKNGSSTIQLTHIGKDDFPVLSPNKKTIAFIRKGDKTIPQSCDGFVSTTSGYGDQIWTYDLERNKERLLVANDFSCDKPTKKIVDLGDLQFSPDSKTLYFITSAWVTSGALHAVNVDSAHQRYVMPANSFEVVPKGQYKGYLIVQKHRYFVGGGSYDWLWLYTPQGHEEGPLGEEVTQDQREFLETGLYH